MFGKRLDIALYICFSLSATVIADDPHKEAADVANEYFQLWKSGKTCEGIEKYWDLDRLFEENFSDDYESLSESDRSYLQHQMTVFVTFVNRVPAVKQKLRLAVLDHQQVIELSGKKVRVLTKVTAGDFENIVFADLIPNSEGWKIINVGANGQGFEVLKPLWKQYKSSQIINTSLNDYFEHVLWEGLSKKYAATP